ncbi:MAG: AmmeMemoRadiSam system protein A [Thermaerobacter sp.]|nr:AmmeMemoRadiSam system protein A [Thermaerobacter sp.]
MDKLSVHTRLARQSLEHYLRTGRLLSTPQPLPAELSVRAGAFVTLHAGEHLRGCIGTYAPTQDNLAEEVIRNAVRAGVADPRFPPVGAAELPGLTLSVDVLGPLEPVAEPRRELDPRRYGVVVRKGDRSALLLPDLAGVDTVERQMALVCQKAGLDPGEEGIQVWRFAAERHLEDERPGGGGAF